MTLTAQKALGSIGMKERSHALHTTSTYAWPKDCHADLARRHQLDAPCFRTSNIVMEPPRAWANQRYSPSQPRRAAKAMWGIRMKTRTTSPPASSTGPEKTWHVKTREEATRLVRASEKTQASRYAAEDMGEPAG